MIRRQIFVWLNILAVLSLLIAGCKPAATAQPTVKPPEKTQPPTEVKPTEAKPVPTEEKVTLTIWDTGTEYYQWVEDIAIPLFKEKHPNVEFVHTGIPYDQFSLKIDTASTAGDLPDMIADEVPGANVKWFKSGLLIPLDSYMTTDSVNKGDYCGLIDNASLESQTYMLPMFVNFWGMLYNKKMFKEANLPELSTDSVITFDQWLDYARKLNKPSDKLETRVWGSQMFRLDWNSLAAGFSNPYYLGSDGKTCAGNADTPDMVHAWEKIRDAYKEDLTPETGMALLGDQSAWLFFTDGKVAISYGDMSMANQAVEKGIEVGITGQPVITPGYEMNVHLYGMGFGITKTSKHPDLAWEFVKLTSTVIPLKLVGAKIYGEATAGIPCYKPIADQYIQESKNPLLTDAQKIIARSKPIPFTPDYYVGATAIWNEINTRVIEKGEDVVTVIKDSISLCQKAVDDMWEQWNSIK